MGKTYEELMSELSPERRKRVEARAAELIAEEKSLRDLRKARQLTQQRMAKKLGVRQHSISRLEQRSDMLLSTLRDYIGKMGGELVLTARFPDRPSVRIKGLAGIAGTSRAERTRPSQRLHVAQRDVWFRQRVQGALDDPRPPVPSKTVEQHFAKRRAAARRKSATRAR